MPPKNAASTMNNRSGNRERFPDCDAGGTADGGESDATSLMTEPLLFPCKLAEGVYYSQCRYTLFFMTNVTCIQRNLSQTHR
jgi:hypothetical protein